MAQVRPTVSLKAQDAPPPAALGIGLSKRTLIQGLVGSILILIGALGAGGDLINDPVLGDGPLSALRYGHGRNLATAVLYIGVFLLVWARETENAQDNDMIVIGDSRML